MHNHSVFPPYVGVIFVAVAVAGAAMAVRFARRRLVQTAWQRMAAMLDGGLTVDHQTQHRIVRGSYRGYTALLKQAISYEENIPYPHTRGGIIARNPSQVVIGLRHKSLLEEYLTRKDSCAVSTGDADFDRAFFVVISVPEHVEPLLTHKTRKSLMRNNDVEIYLKSSQMEWRRSGLLTSFDDAQRLFEAVADIADALALLPPREISLDKRREEEALIEQGV